MIRSLIVDDETRNVFILEKLIEQFCQDVTVVATASTVADAIIKIKQTKPDVVFLDIEMPGKNAFDLLEDLRPVNFEVIFVTAFDQHAIKAFRVGALDYLLKPVSIDDLKNSIQRVKERWQSAGANEKVEEYLNLLHKKESAKKIVLSVKEGLISYDIDKVLYCISEGAYTVFYFLDKSKIFTSGSLKSFEEILPSDSFARIHHSVIVNINQVATYTKGRGGYVTMTNGIKLDVAQRKRDEFLQKYNPQ
jgi:two-component system, LytTR family, response regulator